MFSLSSCLVNSLFVVSVFIVSNSADNSIQLRILESAEYLNKSNPSSVFIPQSEHAASHSRLISPCGGTFKSLQTVILTPNYPDKYPRNTRCEFVFKSPYVCKTAFHVQFLDFELESSDKCFKDKLCIENSEVLCGQVIGSRVYNATNGILRMVFQSDDSGEYRGFRMVVTRQPCGDEDQAVRMAHRFEMPYYNDVASPKPRKYGVDSIETKKQDQHSHRGDIPVAYPDYGSNYNPFQNPSQQPAFNSPTPAYPPIYICLPQFSYLYPENSPTPITPSPFSPATPQQPPFQSLPGLYPAPPFNSVNTIPAQLPAPNSPGNYPFYRQPTTFTTNSFPELSQSPPPPKVETQVSPFLPTTIPSCCRRTYSGKRFYLTSPNFPDFNTNPTDCLFYIEKADPSTCRLRIVLKFFALGVASTAGCFENFIEIDGQRICGCRTGLVYTSQWGLGAKVLRVKTRGGRNGAFLVEIIQEQCPYRYMRNAMIAKRIDEPISSTLVESNSTVRTLYTFYGQGRNASQERGQYVDESTTEGPSSQFLVGSFNGAGCSFSIADWIRLSVDSLWIERPRCL